jgi:hypothetical protein
MRRTFITRTNRVQKNQSIQYYLVFSRARRKLPMMFTMALLHAQVRYNRYQKGIEKICLRFSKYSHHEKTDIHI